jgi:hypothetical protein
VEEQAVEFLTVKDEWKMSETKYCITVFWPVLQMLRYPEATDVVQLSNGSLEFTDSQGVMHTVSRVIPWCVEEYKQ